MNVAVDHVLRIVQDRPRLVGENDLYFTSRRLDEIAVICHIIHTGELVLILSEKLSVLLQREDVAIRIHARLIDLIEAYEAVSDFIGRIGEHQNDLLASHRDTAKADRKTVSTEDRENNTYCLAAELCFHIFCNILYCTIVALGSCNDRLCHRDNITVTKFKALGFCRFQYGLGNDFAKVVSLTDDRAADAP